MPSRKGQQQQGAPASAALAGRSGLVFGDGDRVLDKGVWKRWKNCQTCQQIVVERAKWKDCWEEIRFCSDRCKAEAKRARRTQQHGQDDVQAQGSEGKHEQEDIAAQEEQPKGGQRRSKKQSQRDLPDEA